MSKNCKNCITTDDVGAAFGVLVFSVSMILFGYLIGRLSNSDIGKIQEHAYKCGRDNASTLYYQYLDVVCGK